MREVYRCTKPGGWVEHAEFSMESFSDDKTHGPNYTRLITLFNEALNKIGRPSPAPQSMKAALEKVGFVDVTVVTKKYPQGIWPKDRRLKHIGAMALLAAETGLEAYTLALLTRVLEINGEEAKQINRDALKDIKDRRYHSYHDLYETPAGPKLIACSYADIPKLRRIRAKAGVKGVFLRFKTGFIFLRSATGWWLVVPARKWVKH
jgi:hypothetical protein